MSEQRKNKTSDGGKSAGIAWTEQTWNPIRGCSKVSAGCTHCYAEAMAGRFSGPGQPYEGISNGKRWTGKVEFVVDKLAEPLRWTKPRLVFVNSMSDLFHEALSFDQIAAIWGVMAASPKHTFQVLTKRPARALEWFRWLREKATSWAAEDAEPDQARLEYLWMVAAEAGAEGEYGDAWPLPNVWLGVSAEDQATANERIPLLLQCPAAVRWVSAEPLLGPLYIYGWLLGGCPLCGSGLYSNDVWLGTTCQQCAERRPGQDPYGGQPVRVDWVVIGGESGPKARVCDGDWIQGIMADSRGARVPVFVKQLGAAYCDAANGLVGHGVATMDGEIKRLLSVQRLKHHKGGDVDEWPEDLRVRQWPQTRGGKP